MFLLEKCGCVSGNTLAPQASIDIESLSIHSASGTNAVKLSIITKFTLNYTTFASGDCFLVYKRSSHIPETIKTSEIAHPDHLYLIPFK